MKILTLTFAETDGEMSFYLNFSKLTSSTVGNTSISYMDLKLSFL